MRDRTIKVAEDPLVREIGRTGLGWLLPKIARSKTPDRAKFDADHLTVIGPRSPVRIPIVEIKAVEAVRGPFWSTLRVEHGSKQSEVLWLDRTEAKSFAGALQEVIEPRKTLAAHSAPIKAVFDRLKELEDTPKYIRHGAYSAWVRSAERATRGLPDDWPKVLSSLPEIAMLAKIWDMLDKPEEFRKVANGRYVTAELTRSKAFFDSVVPHSLTDEQKRAVVVDEDRNLVIAAAGSGKTFVLAEKVRWLLQRGDLSPSDLLVLAYSTDACDELAKRIAKPSDSEKTDGIQIRTFHSLGMSIIRRVEKRRPPLARMATDGAAFHAELKSIVSELVRTDQQFAAVLRGWFQSHFAPYRSLHECKHYGEYWDYLRRYKIKSLKGEKVRSFEECEIANFLCLNDVRYEHRSNYRHQDPKREKRNYQPSFYLPDAEIYIEVVALSDSGAVPVCAMPGWEGSLESVEWKRGVHAKHRTVLVEAYTHERAAGTLIPNLSENLRRRGVVLTPTPNSEVFDVLDRHSAMDRFVSLIATFIRHFKGSRLSRPDLVGRANKAKDRVRANGFGFVFDRVFDRYRERLEASGRIDFDDMINRATEYVEAGEADAAFQYILIDEFQDISQSRARLVQALLRRVPDAQLFAVGDDWQAIMRFSGADIAIMKGFEEYFGHTECRYLENTFRCTKTIADVAREFVLKNDDQIKKNVVPCGPENGIGVCIGFPGPVESFRKNGNRPANGREGPDQPPLVGAMAAIDDDARDRGGSSSVFLLGRYGPTIPNDSIVSKLTSRYPNLCFETKTIHASKGLSADYVVVFGLGAGELNFPSQIVDDPILDLVLPEREQHENAEERRLMYVALTRARRLVFLLADKAPPSPFVVELLGAEYGVGRFGRSPQEEPRCLVCVEGRLTRQREDDGGRTFYYCSNGPYCDHRQPACPNPECGNGLPTPERRMFRCRACRASYRPCRDCDGGWMLTRKSEYGEFLGCANFPDCKGKADL